jgi:hypothetical protein
MKVVEKGRDISGMLRNELKHCQGMLESLQEAVSSLPAAQ